MQVAANQSHHGATWQCLDAASRFSTDNFCLAHLTSLNYWNGSFIPKLPISPTSLTLIQQISQIEGQYSGALTFNAALTKSPLESEKDTKVHRNFHYWDISMMCLKPFSFHPSFFYHDELRIQDLKILGKPNTEIFWDILTQSYWKFVFDLYSLGSLVFM